MAFYGLRLEYALDGSSNYIAWKDHMEEVLEDNSLKDLIDQEVPKPTDATQLEEWKKCVARARRIILEGVQDHIVSSLHGKETLFAMWKILKDLYQNNSSQRKLALKDKLRKIKCEKGDTITTFLNKLTNCKDELASIGITTANDDMVSIALLGLPKSWHSYQESVDGREKLPDWERLWSDLMQEEIRQSTRDGSSSKHDDEDNLALVTKAKKGKGKASQSKSSQGDKNIFSTLKEKDLQIRIKMGDDGKHHVSGEGTVVFQRENGSPLTLSNVMYVPGLKKNLVSIAMLEDKGYDVVFSLGKVFLRHIGTGQTKQIGIRVKNLYNLQVDDCAALGSKAEVVHGQDIGKLWHRRLGHLHHGALKITQQISTRLPKCKLEQTSTCKGCTLGKYAKSSFQDQDIRVGETLERVHSDECGPFSIASTTKHRYYVISVHYFSHRCWIYFMQKKDQTFLKFCEFKYLAKKGSGMKLKALQSDDDVEYVSQQFKDFCASKGIKWELTTTHNPQQNGVVKWKNRSIVGAARAMLHDQGLPLHLWVEA
eukprot:PITA_27856